MFAKIGKFKVYKIGSARVSARLIDILFLSITGFLSFSFYYQFEIPVLQYKNIFIRILSVLPIYFFVLDWFSLRYRPLFLSRSLIGLLHLSLRIILVEFIYFFLSYILFDNKTSRPFPQETILIAGGIILTSLWSFYLQSNYSNLVSYYPQNFQARTHPFFIKGAQRHKMNQRMKQSIFTTVLITIISLTIFWIYGFTHNDDQTKNLAAPLFDDKIKIYVEPKDFNYLKSMVDQYKNKQVLESEGKKFVDAHFVYKDQKFSIKLRLKGDWANHINEDRKWSFRIKVKNGNAFQGMRNFSIQHPKTRNWLSEYFALRVLRDHDILAPRASYVRVMVNNEDWGIYFLEEFPGKELLESQNRRESVIIHIDESMWWSSVAIALSTGTKNLATAPLAGLGSYKPFNYKKVLEDKNLSKLYRASVQKLIMFSQGKIKKHQVYDIKKTAQYCSWIQLLGGQHAIAPHNQKFYYNPITSLLEPVYREGEPGGHGIKIGLISSSVCNEADARYLEYLTQISEPGYIDRLIKKYQPIMKKYEKFLQEEWPSYKFNYFPILRQGAQLIHGHIHYKDKSFSFLPRSYRALKNQSSNNKIIISLQNLKKVSIKLISVFCKTRKQMIRLDILDHDLLLNSDRSTYVLRPNQRSKFNFLKVRLPKSIPLSNDPKLFLKIELWGTKQTYMVPIREKQFYEPTVISGFLKNQSKTSMESYPFLKINSKSKTIFLKPGKWKILKDLIIPSGYSVVIPAGTHFSFAQNTAFISYSPIKILGLKEKPVIFDAIKNRWDGFAVINSKVFTRNRLNDYKLAYEKSSLKSMIRYLIISQTTGIERFGLKLTGGVTFYYTNVTIENSRFLNSYAEDALNCIRSVSFLRNNLFKDIASDAIDFDFGKSELSNSYFTKINGDALDFSGHKGNVFNISISHVKDKAISAGESSNLTISHTNIKFSNIGIASKDSSKVNVNVSSVNQGKIGLAAFNKKTEYQGGSLIVQNSELKEMKNNYLLESGSSIQLNGENLKPNAKDLAKKLY